MQRTKWTTGDGQLVAAGLAAVGVFTIIIGVQLKTESYESLFGILTAAGIVAISLPFLRRISDRMGDPMIFKLLFAGLALKLLGAVVRFLVIYFVYGGRGDFASYHDDAVGLLSAWRRGDFGSPLINLEQRPATTQRIAYLTGATYVITGPSVFSGFFVFAWLSYIGVVMCWQAVCHAVHGVDPRRAAVVLLAFPSLLFWPSSIGKDGVMLLFVGFTALGASHLLAAPVRWRGLVWFLVGLGGMTLIRPHIALMAVVALVVALALSVVAGRGGPHDVSAAARVGRAFAVVLLVGVTSVASTQVTKSFNIGAAGEGGTEDAFLLALDQTSTGGSSFAPVAVSSPLEVPAAFVSVLFRPFPWEASGTTGLLAAAEALILLVLCAVNWRRLVAWPRVAWRNPYLLFAMLYSTAFIIGFSYIGNFGILARQRVQLLPLFLPVLLIPLRGDRNWVDDETDEGRPTSTPAASARRADALVSPG